MNLKTKEVISLRVNPEDKQAFEELTRKIPVENKSELFLEMLKAYKEKTDLNRKPETPEPIQAEENTETEETKEQQFVVSLNPIQYFAISETLMKPGFIEETNKTVEKVDNGIDDSFFGNDLYSGLFAGVFKKMEANQNEIKSMSKNIDAVLVNLFMANILTNSEYLESPVTKAVLKRHIQSQATPETKKKATEEYLGY